MFSHLRTLVLLAALALLVPPLARPAAAWHPPPRAMPGDTVSLGFACTGVFPGPGAPNAR